MYFQSKAISGYFSLVLICEVGIASLLPLAVLVGLDTLFLLQVNETVMDAMHDLNVVVSKIDVVTKQIEKRHLALYAGFLAVMMVVNGFS